MSALSSRSPSENGPATRPQLPSFRSFEAELTRPIDHTLQLAPMRRVEHPLPPRPVDTQLHPDYHWQEHNLDKCTCSLDAMAHPHVGATPPAPFTTYRYPTAVHRLPSPPSRPQHAFLTASSPPSPLRQHQELPSMPSFSSAQPPSPHSQPFSPPPAQNPSPARQPSPPSSNRRSRGTTSRPRWRAEERLQLFKAVSKDKELENMSTFNWDAISVQVGRPRKSCKDQWRREILRMIIEIFEHQTLAGRNLGFVLREHDDDSMEDDSE